MYKQYIGGKMVEGRGKPLAVLNPATGETIAEFKTVTSVQAKAALESARDAFKTWSVVPVGERIGWMLKLREACLAEKEKIIALVSAESGRVPDAAKADFDWFMISLVYYGEEVKRLNGAVIPSLNMPYGGTYYIVERRPVGVVVGHLAWNYPLGNAGLKIGPAMASGCPCIIKPSSKTPLATLYVGELAEKIGLPAGVLNILSGSSGEVGRTINSSTIPKMITLIGSSETGRRIMQEGATSIKKYSFELGGNAPVIVMDDADVDKTACNIIAKKTGFAGQTCVNYNRIYVHEKIYDRLCESIAAYLKEVGIGEKFKYNLSPLISRESRDRISGLIDDAVKSGAKLVAGGKIPAGHEKGNYITPALLKDVTDSMRVSREEIFGPVIPLQPFSDLDDALKKANDTIYGLSAYFFGHDSREIGKTLRTLDAGEIFVNGADGNELIPHSGTKQSGVGVDKSTWSLEEYFDFKTIAMVP